MSAYLATFPVFRAFDQFGFPLAGGKLYTYAAGTTTPQATYTDASGTTPNANPVILDSTGQANVWLGQGLSYKMVLKDTFNVTLWTVDGISDAVNNLRLDLADTTDPAKGDALIGVRLNALNAVGRTQHDKNADIVSVKDFGAKGDGVTDDGNAIRYAHASSSHVYYPAGVYKFSGDPITQKEANFSMIGDGPGLTTIQLAANTQFHTYGSVVDSLTVSGISFTGGLGFFKWTSTATNVNNEKMFNNCTFKLYTRCAVENNYSDSPYWKFYDCIFIAANSTSTIGVALGSNSDLSVFDSCSFLKNRIHVKGLGALIRTKFDKCDFLQFDAGDGTPRAFVWAVPNPSIINAGVGCCVSNSKFGNENQQATDYRVLYADEGAGISNGDKFPNLASDSAGHVAGHLFRGISINGSYATPLVYSTTTNLYDTYIDSCTISGTPPSYYVQVRTPTTTFDRNTLQIVLSGVTGAAGINTQTIPLSNQVVQRAVSDRLGLLEPDSANIASYPVCGANRVGYTQLLSTRITSFFTGGAASKVGNITDATGGSEAAEYSLPSGLVYAYLSSPTIGEPTWIQIDLKASATTPLTLVVLRLRYDSNGSIAFQRFIRVPSNWRSYKFPLYFVNNGSNIICEITNGASGSLVQIGRVRIYHSREPIVTNYATFEQLNLSALPTSSAGLPAGSLWVDTAAGNVIKRV